MVFVLPTPFASAAPWLQDKQQFYTRIEMANEVVNGLRGTRTDLYLEYGAARDWTVSLKASNLSYDGAEDFNTNGWRATVRRRLFSTGPFVASAEAGLVQGAAIGGRSGCDPLGFEARGGLGWSGTWKTRDIYAFGEVASRTYDNCRRQRLALGLGQQTAKQVWSVTQVWLEQGDSIAHSYKLQSELLWRTKIADVSIGYREEFGGAFEEESVFIAIADHF